MADPPRPSAPRSLCRINDNWTQLHKWSAAEKIKLGQKERYGIFSLTERYFVLEYLWNSPFLGNLF
jgi:hypothetical protein